MAFVNNSMLKEITHHLVRVPFTAFEWSSELTRVCIYHGSRVPALFCPSIHRYSLNFIIYSKRIVVFRGKCPSQMSWDTSLHQEPPHHSVGQMKDHLQKLSLQGVRYVSTSRMSKPYGDCTLETELKTTQYTGIYSVSSFSTNSAKIKKLI